MQQPFQSKLVVCDICDTLYASNTTFDFLHYMFSKERGINLFLMLSLKSKWSPVYYFFELLGRVLKKDLIRSASLKLLKGKNYGEVLEHAQSFYHQLLVSRANEKIFQLLNRESDGSEVFLVSSSIDPIVQTIGKENKMQYISSTLEQINGIVTGRLLNDLTKQKHLVVKKLMEARGISKLLVITDNRGDLELVKMADERFVVIKSEQEKSFWTELNPNFLFV